MICKYGSDSTSTLYKSIQLNAIGKYPHLLIENGYEASSEVSLVFDKVYIGQNQTKYFTIINMTEVGNELLRQNQFNAVNLIFVMRTKGGHEFYGRTKSGYTRV